MEESPTQKSIEELLAALNNSDPKLRESVLASLANSGIMDKKLIDELRIIARGDPDSKVRLAAKKTLKSLGIKAPERKLPGIGIGNTGLSRDGDFRTGVILWIALNFILGLVVFALNFDSFTGTLQLIVNVGLLIYFGFTRPNIAMGMLTAFGSVFAVSLCLGILFWATCFIGIGSR